MEQATSVLLKITEYQYSSFSAVEPDSLGEGFALMLLSLRENDSRNGMANFLGVKGGRRSLL